LFSTIWRKKNEKNFDSCERRTERRTREEERASSFHFSLLLMMR